MSDWTIPKIKRLYTEIEHVACEEFDVPRRLYLLEIDVPDSLSKADSDVTVISVSASDSLEDMGRTFAATLVGMHRVDEVMAKVAGQPGVPEMDLSWSWQVALPSTRRRKRRG